jgi:TonB-linked SusC/RagA family outer membrane protein
MATLILRSDGSSNFARGNRWGYFPSVSAGWVISNEKFMSDLSQSWLDFLKIRASWGRNGNQSIDNFQYISPVAFDQSHVYNFGNTMLSSTGAKSVGAFTTVLANPDVTWETSEQLNAGFDAYLFNSRMTINFDYYVKTTKDWLVKAPVLAATGTEAPYINGGDVRNRGLELNLGWRDHIKKDFSYNVNFNLSYNENEVTRIANSEGVIHGDDKVLGNVDIMGEFYRAQVGYPVGYFWGYKTGGVFQNQQQINDWIASGHAVAQSKPVPGDLIYTDVIDDGVINDADRTMIGDPNPDFRLGFNANIMWKGLDLSITCQSALGHQLVYAYRSNTTDVLNYWHGEGTNNRFPRLNSTDPTGMNDTRIEDGDYLKIQNVTLGYDFKHLLPGIPLQKMRFYVSAQNLFTFTKYPGLDPEVGFGGADLLGNQRAWCSGIDLGSYPSARTILIGINIQF